MVMICGAKPSREKHENESLSGHALREPFISDKKES
jgi:hypothetical protein